MNRIPIADHYDQQSEKTSLLSKKKFFQKELSLLFIVGVVGCMGTMFIFSKGWYNTGSHSSQSLEAISIPQKKSAVIPSRELSTFLQVKGEYFVNNPLDFQITNFNPKAIYQVDFGDGTISELAAEEFSHSYVKAGEYQLRLNIKYKKENAALFEMVITINETKEAFLTSL